MSSLAIDHLISFGSGEYFLLLGLVLFGRTMDLFSTWVATPSLELEANPLARGLGWRGGMVANAMASLVLALIPIAAISVATTSLLVAARNLQSAWLVRAVGEFEYRAWVAARYRESRRGVFVICLILQTALIGLLGFALMVFSDRRLIPFAMGLGVVTYAAAVAGFTAYGMHVAAQRQAQTLENLCARQPTETTGPDVDQGARR